jgi:hypothetical protein
MITNKLTGGFGARRNGGQVRRAPDLRTMENRVSPMLRRQAHDRRSHWAQWKLNLCVETKNFKIVPAGRKQSNVTSSTTSDEPFRERCS